MNKIACAHPGKIGDALYALPTVRALCRQHDAVCDFYTSEHCAPMKDLVEHQLYIHQMIVPAGYEIQSHDCGIQPWHMPVDPRGYVAVYQMGFQGCPSGFIAGYIAEKAGLPRAVGDDCQLVAPRSMYAGMFTDGYVTLCARGETSYAPLFREFVKRCALPCFEVGAPGQAVCGGVDRTGRSLLEMASLISGSRAYLGLMSGPLVVANGFPGVTKIVPHDGIHWDMSHVLRAPNNHYLVNPTVEELLAKL